MSDDLSIPDRERVLTHLRAQRSRLEAMGVRHARLYGSVARGDAGPDSDVDVIVELARPEMDVFDLAAIAGERRRGLGHPVDVTTPDRAPPGRTVDAF